MITPSDVDYQLTKRKKKNGEPLPPPFKQLADWFKITYDVEVLNLYYDTVILTTDLD